MIISLRCLIIHGFPSVAIRLGIIIWCCSNGRVFVAISTTDPPFDNPNLSNGLKTNWIFLQDDSLIKHRNVSIVVTAHVGATACTSNSTTVVLGTVGNAKLTQQHHCSAGYCR